MTVQRRTGLHKALLALLSLVATCLLLVAGIVLVAPVTSTPVMARDTALSAVVIAVPPTQVIDPFTGVKDDQSAVIWDLLNGWVADQDNGDPSSLQYVQYPQSVWFLTGPGDPPVDTSRDIGATNLNARIAAISGPAVVVGYSQGSSVNTRWLNWYKAGKLPNASDPSMLSFVNAGNPNRPNGGMAERFVGMYIPGFAITFDGATPSDTPYPVTEVAHEYDGFADFPKYVLNLPADINAIMGILFVHAFYDRIDLNDPSNIVTHDGNLTDVLARTPVLPIMQPFYIAAHLLGRTETPVLNAISAPLRDFIDSAYDRTTAKATPADFGNPFQHLDVTALKESVTRSVKTLLSGSPQATSTRTFTQFPDLRGVVKSLTTAPVNMATVNQAMVKSAETFLYGTPKRATSTQSPVSGQQSSKKPEPEPTKSVVSEPVKHDAPEPKKRDASKLVKSSTSQPSSQKSNDRPRQTTKRAHDLSASSATPAPKGKSTKSGAQTPGKRGPAGHAQAGGGKS